MAFIPRPNGVKLCLVWDRDGQDVVMCLSLVLPSPADTAKLNDIVDAAEAWRVDFINPVVNGGFTATQWEATALDSATAPGIIVPITADADGTRTGSTLPGHTALAIQHLTDLKGRSYRGRTFFGGMTNTDQVGPFQMTADYAADCIAALVAFQLAMGTVTAEHVVASYQNAGAARTTGVSTPITAYSANLDIDSQRRRLAGRGT